MKKIIFSCISAAALLACTKALPASAAVSGDANGNGPGGPGGRTK